MVVDVKTEARPSPGLARVGDGAPIRLAALSNARLSPAINWSTLAPPLLKPLAERAGAQLIAPPPLRWAHRDDWRGAVRQFRDCDAAFWMQSASHPELPVWALAATRPTIPRSAFVVDAFRPLLTKIGALAVAQRLDPCFVAFREASEELQRRFPRGRFEWLPFGIDTDVFKPRPEVEIRDIFAYWMGRRDERLHLALRRYCEERGLQYRYTRTSGEFADPQALGELVARCRYFVVTPPNASRTGGFSPLVMRYMEGLAAGARLLGVLPESGEFEDLFPRAALCEVAPDGSDLAERLDADAGDAEAWRCVAKAGEIVRREHSWHRRADQIHARLGTG